jgi:hypothetical protein
VTFLDKLESKSRADSTVSGAGRIREFMVK